MVAFTGYILMMLAVARPGHSTHFDQEVAAVAQGRHDGSSIWPSVAWFLFLFSMTALMGFIIAISIFITTFLLMRTTLGPARSLVYMVACVAFMSALGHFLTLDFPPGLLQHHVELPWPLK
jgi:hypothetical protein